MKCCVEGCEQPVVVHIVTGARQPAESSYCGASYCSWQHLAMSAESIVVKWAGDPRGYCVAPVTVPGQDQGGSE